jgi:hypothetical protein
VWRKWRHKGYCGDLKVFQIPTYALVDEDPGNPNTAKVVGELKALLGDNSVLLQKPNLEGMLGLAKKPSKAEAMKVLPSWFQMNEMPAVYTDLKKALKSEGRSFPNDTPSPNNSTLRAPA